MAEAQTATDNNGHGPWAGVGLGRPVAPTVIPGGVGSLVSPGRELSRHARPW